MFYLHFYFSVFISLCVKYLMERIMTGGIKVLIDLIKYIILFFLILIWSVGVIIIRSSTNFFKKVLTLFKK